MMSGQGVNFHVDKYKKGTREEAMADIEAARKMAESAPDFGPSRIILAAKEAAFDIVFGADPAEASRQAESLPGPGQTPPALPPSPKRQREMQHQDEKSAQDAEERARLEQQRQQKERQDAAERARQQQQQAEENQRRERQLQIQELRQPRVTPDQEALANKYYQTPYARLKPEDKARIDSRIRLEKEYDAIEKTRNSPVVRGYFEELDAMDNSKRMVDLIRPRITGSTIGIWGRMKGVGQNLVQNIPLLPDSIKAKAFDPRVNEVQTLTAVLAYMHAAAVKKAGAQSGGRGVIAADIKRAEEYLDPKAWLANPREAFAVLGALQEFIQSGREVTEERLRAEGFDPKTRQPLLGHKFLPREEGEQPSGKGADPHQDSIDFIYDQTGGRQQ